MNEILEVNDDNFQSEVLDSPNTVMVDFWADWCLPCKVMSPMIDELAQEFEGKIKICKADIEKISKFTKSLKISAVPSILFFKNGEIVCREVGSKSKKVIEMRIQEFLN